MTPASTPQDAFGQMNGTPQQSGLTFWQKVPDILFGLIPAICMLPISVMGAVFGGLAGVAGLTDVRQSGLLLVFAALVLMGLLGWAALISAIFLRWRGELHSGRRWLKAGLWCAFISGLVFSLNLLQKSEFSSQTLLSTLINLLVQRPFLGYVMFSPVVLTAVYLRRLQSGGHS